MSLVIEKYELNSYLNTQHELNITQQKKLTSFSSLPLAPLRPIVFSHPSEEEFARLLDFYRVEWIYEPRSFPLSWEDNRITEMFTPDFYLPELDVYIEYWGLDTPQYKMSMYKKQTLYQQEGKRLISVYPSNLPRLGALLAAKLKLLGFVTGADQRSEVSAD